MRLLVVEDQKKMLHFLERGLREQGYSVDSAQSAAAASALSYENEYDLILLDVMLPDKNGMDLARELRGDGYKGPILMLTALSRTRDKVGGLDAGADDYLTKPFEFEELLARVRALLRRGHSSLSTLLTYQDVEMDLVQRVVTRGGQAIDLTQKEFSLLEYFVRNSERPLTRTELGEHVWDMNFDPESNVIDVYVSMLRKKLDSPFAKKLIHTVVGVGYIMSEEDRLARRS